MLVNRLAELEQHLRSLPPEAPRFDISTWLEQTHCGSCACIAGHAILLFRPDRAKTTSPMSLARDLLGLTYPEADALFCPKGMGDDQFDKAVTAEHGADAVRALINGGTQGVRDFWRDTYRDIMEVDCD